MSVSKVAVLGAGPLGAEVAQRVAAAGLPVVLGDDDPAAAQQGIAHARALTEAEVARAGITGPAATARVEEVLRRIAAAEGTAGCGDVDLAIEAVPDTLEDKQDALEDLDAATPGYALLATTTRVLSVAAAGAVTTRPEQVLGLHFFGPAGLLEIVEGDDTSPEAVETALRFAGVLGYTPVRALESPGYIVDRVLGALVAEALAIHAEEGYDAPAIDAAAAAAGLMPDGPFRYADRAGLDAVLASAELLADQFGERFAVPVALRERVAAGALGTASGEGFYSYE